MGNVLLTGADGFIGRATYAALNSAGADVRATVRRRSYKRGRCADTIETGDIATFPKWLEVLRNVDCVVHLANIAHIGHAGVDRARLTNIDGSIRIARNAIDAGVKRLVFISSAKVHGEESSNGPISEKSEIAPQDAYARIKFEAEWRLRDIAARGNLELVILRPPLVYGPWVKANFLSLIRALNLGVPLPFASIRNQRSFVYVFNLADAIARCVASEAARDRTYLVTDGISLSTPELCQLLGAALGRPARLFSFPTSLLELWPPIRKLTRSFQIDDSAIRDELGWVPPFMLEEGIRATANWCATEGLGLRG